MADYLQTEIQFIPGVGPKKAALLRSELNIYTVKDLLQYYPYRYVDRSKFYKISELHPSMPYVQIRGKFMTAKTIDANRKQRFVAHFSDGAGYIELIWFKSIKWVKDAINHDVEYVVYGKPSEFNGIVNIVHPEFERAEKFTIQLGNTLQAMYNTTEKMKRANLHSKAILNMQREVASRLKMVTVSESLPAYLLSKLNLITLTDTYRFIHFPENFDQLNRAQYRIKFEELFYIQLNLIHQKLAIKRVFNGHKFQKNDNVLKEFYKKYLPFTLTGAQIRVLGEIRKDLLVGQQMNRLIQGDVGSGKTLVAFMSMLMAIDNGLQTCLMAPTEILATQHFKSLVEFTDGLGITMELLTGSTRKKARERIHEGLRNGELKILVGTHALIEDEVRFKNLGLCVIDEQHRFGVAQRAKLWNKNTPPPHVLVMTATPIPRTLAMTLYGDLDVSVIDELPPGRKPVKTIHFYDSKRSRMFGFLREQIKLGRQVYIVYPLISESEKMDYKDLEDGYEAISRAFPLPEYQVSIVHGKMKSKDKERSMQLFADAKAQIMVATTVIEVGVNIPNASVMVIESAERFGLSQLHQLRGRVGRGADQSYCILMSSYKLSEEGRKRIETMVSTNDGFVISEVDLKLRGPGDLEGTKQSGIPFSLKMANLAKDTQILEFARNIAIKIIDNDPQLNKEEHHVLKRLLKNMFTNNTNWGRIS